MRKITTMIMVIVCVLVFLSSLAFAQDTRYRKKTIIDFDDVLLEGELKKPAGAYITERRELSFRNLIKTRKNFEQEMFRSVDVLK